MAVALVEEEIRVVDLLAQVASPKDGALALFLGAVRDENEGRRVLFLEYDAYPAMAKAEMARIEAEARSRFPVSSVAVSHRTGRLEIGEISVGVAVAAPHRADAMDACRFVIDEVKRRVPIWKKEHFEGGAVWIEGDRSGGGA